MHILDQQIQKYRYSTGNFILGAIIACVVFVLMGLSQLDIEYVKEEEPQPLLDFHLPPPPPPVVKVIQKSDTKPVSINFSLPTTSEPSSVPVGFLEVEFGLNPKQLTNVEISVQDTVDSYETDGLKELEVYDIEDVTQKPVRRKAGRLSVSKAYTNGVSKAFTFVYIARINKRGIPDDIHFLRCPYPEAIPTLRRWIRNCRFWPAKKDGRTVECLIKQEVIYNPNSSSPFTI